MSQRYDTLTALLAVRDPGWRFRLCGHGDCGYIEPERGKGGLHLQHLKTPERQQQAELLAVAPAALADALPVVTAAEALLKALGELPGAPPGTLGAIHGLVNALVAFHGGGER